MTFPGNETSEFIFDHANKRHFLWSLMQVRPILQSVPSRNVFQILVYDNFLVLKTIVGYLDCIHASATEKSTIYQVKYSKFSHIIFLIFKVRLVISFSSGYSTCAENCRMFEALFSRLCIRSSNLFEGYRDQMEGEREIYKY